MLNDVQGFISVGGKGYTQYHSIFLLGKVNTNQVLLSLADVSAEEETDVGCTEVSENEQVAHERKKQRNGVDANGGFEFAEHDVKIAGRNGEQQFIGALPAFVRPDSHRDRGNEDEHDERKPTVQLVEICKVGVEEVIWQERRNGTEQNENADEYVTRRIGKIADEVAFENRIEDFRVHGC